MASSTQEPVTTDFDKYINWVDEENEINVNVTSNDGTTKIEKQKRLWKNMEICADKLFFCGDPEGPQARDKKDIQITFNGYERCSKFNTDMRIYGDVREDEPSTSRNKLLETFQDSKTASGGRNQIICRSENFRIFDTRARNTTLKIDKFANYIYNDNIYNQTYNPPKILDVASSPVDIDEEKNPIVNESSMIINVDKFSINKFGITENIDENGKKSYSYSAGDNLEIFKISTTPNFQTKTTTTVEGSENPVTTIQEPVISISGEGVINDTKIESIMNNEEKLKNSQHLLVDLSTILGLVPKICKQLTPKISTRFCNFYDESQKDNSDKNNQTFIEFDFPEDNFGYANIEFPPSTKDESSKPTDFAVDYPENWSYNLKFGDYDCILIKPINENSQTIQQINLDLLFRINIPDVSPSGLSLGEMIENIYIDFVFAEVIEVNFDETNENPKTITSIKRLQSQPKYRNKLTLVNGEGYTSYQLGWCSCSYTSIYPGSSILINLRGIYSGDYSDSRGKLQIALASGNSDSMIFQREISYNNPESSFKDLPLKIVSPTTTSTTTDGNNE